MRTARLINVNNPFCKEVNIFFFVLDAMAEITEALKVIKLESTPAAEQIKLLEKIGGADAAIAQDLRLNEDFLHLLKSTKISIEVRTKVAKCIADITKTDAQRKHFTETEVMRSLIDAIQLIDQTTHMELVVQVCRALGNIFYQNDDALEILMKIGGDEALIKLLDVSKQDVQGSDETLIQFVNVRCGLISNYLVGGEAVAKRAMELQIMSKIERIVGECSVDVETSEELLLNILPPLSILTENVPDLNFLPALNQQLVKILGESKNPDIAEMCLDLLHYQAENGKWFF